MATAYFWSMWYPFFSNSDSTTGSTSSLVQDFPRVLKWNWSVPQIQTHLLDHRWDASPTTGNMTIPIPAQIGPLQYSPITGSTLQMEAAVSLKAGLHCRHTLHPAT
jgi:hypothetical protein